jgi:RNA polymerase sigma factor (sigma-70 family)
VTVQDGLMPDIPKLVDHLFRREAGKMVSYLTRLFGLSRLSLAEDVVQDALCQALQSWSVDGLPDNPSAWLMRVARNRAIDLVRRDSHLGELAPELTTLLQQREKSLESQPDFEKAIQDDQLRLMFSCCHPELSTEVQVTLILKTLCGFSVAEIASALLVNHDSIEKRLARARKSLMRRDLLSGWKRSIRRSICCSTRAITAASRKRRSAKTCVTKPCDWHCYCANTLRGLDPGRSHSSRSFASTQPDCLGESTPKAS